MIDQLRPCMPSSPPASSAMKDRIPWICAIAVLAILPQLLYAPSFAELFWFGDDWDLLDQISRLGFWRWVAMPFAENFIPLFKLIWGGAAITSGSYYLMIWIIWITHALNAILFHRLLTSNGLSWRTAVPATVIFALTPANIETLCWATQWSAVISMTFFLAALHVQSAATSPRLRDIVLLFGCALASALCFSRGVVTGLALGLVALYPSPLSRYPNAKQWLHAVICWLPSLGVAAVIALFAGGNQQHVTLQTLLNGAEYASYFFALNPLHHLLPFDGWSWRTVVVLGLANGACILWVWLRATERQRQLVSTLVLFALGSAALVGIGRFHTGLETVPSSRYQYSAQICMLPIYALCIEGLWARLERRKVPRLTFSILASLAAMLLANRYIQRWKSDIADWSVGRGREARELLLVNPAPPAENAVPGIPFMTTQRAKELINEYNLAEQPQRTGTPLSPSP